ncbi:MAG: hypothetical protein ACLTMP_07325 [Eggerthella lenta]
MGELHSRRRTRHRGRGRHGRRGNIRFVTPTRRARLPSWAAVAGALDRAGDELMPTRPGACRRRVIVAHR